MLNILKFIFPILTALCVLMVPVGVGMGIYYLTKKEKGVQVTGNMNHQMYAGFWKRVLACILDALVLLIPLIILQAIVKDDVFGNIIGILAAWLYSALMESSEKQATVGKMALGIKVTDINGGRISFAKATGRHFAKILSGITLGVGYIIVAFTERKQGLHDLIASTLVIVSKGTTSNKSQHETRPVPGNE